MKNIDASISSNPIKGFTILFIKSKARDSQICFAYRVREKA